MGWGKSYDFGLLQGAVLLILGRTFGGERLLGGQAWGSFDCSNSYRGARSGGNKRKRMRNGCEFACGTLCALPFYTTNMSYFFKEITI